MNNDFANEFCGKLPNAYSIIFPPPTHFWALMSRIKYLHFYTLVFLLYAILPFFLHIIGILIYSIALSPSCFLYVVTPQEKKISYVNKTAYIAKNISSALFGSTFKMNVLSVQIPTQSWISKTAGSKNIMYLGSWVSLYTVDVRGVQKVKSFMI